MLQGVKARMLGRQNERNSTGSYFYIWFVFCCSLPNQINSLECSNLTSSEIFFPFEGAIVQEAAKAIFL